MINYLLLTAFFSPAQQSPQVIFLALVFPGIVRHIHGSKHPCVCLQLLQADVWKSPTDRFMFVNLWDTLRLHSQTISHLWWKPMEAQVPQVPSSTCKAKTRKCNGIPPACPPSLRFLINPGFSATHVFLACFLPKIWKDLGLQAFETRLKGLFYSNLRKKLLRGNVVGR